MNPKWRASASANSINFRPQSATLIIGMYGYIVEQKSLFFLHENEDPNDILLVRQDKNFVLPNQFYIIVQHGCWWFPDPVNVLTIRCSHARCNSAGIL